jgi:hypothetical protein
MAIIAGIVGILGRFAGQLLNLTLGWATILLFGKVPQRKQIVLLVMVFGSLVWVALVIGVLVPDVGTFLIALTPAPAFVQDSWLRLAMLIGALVLPLAIGIAAVSVTTKSSRPHGLDLVVGVLRGYPFAFVLALILVMLIGVATVRKLRSLQHRWEDAHVPVIVKPGRYEEALALLRSKLDSGGLPTVPRDAGMLISGPPKLLDLVAGRALGDLVPDKLQLLVGQNLEVLVYPSDLAISGTRDRVAMARALIASELVEAPAYMTTSAEAQTFEDELERLGRGAASKLPVEVIRYVRSLDKKLAKLAVPYDEWETLYRMRLQLERDALSALTDPKPAAAAVAATVTKEPALRPSRLDIAVALAGAGLIALDVALLLGDRRREGDAG